MINVNRAALLIYSVAVACAAALWPLAMTPHAQSQTRTVEFFPMAVWYGGGKARAPMLERDARSKKETWRKDVQQIKALGFNTLRAWVDWA